MFTSVRSALNLDSFRSHSTTSSQPLKEAPYSEIETGNGDSKPSYREKLEAPEDVMDFMGYQI